MKESTALGISLAGIVTLAVAFNAASYFKTKREIEERINIPDNDPAMYAARECAASNLALDNMWRPSLDKTQAARDTLITIMSCQSPR